MHELHTHLEVFFSSFWKLVNVVCNGGCGSMLVRSSDIAVVLFPYCNKVSKKDQFSKGKSLLCLLISEFVIQNGQAQLHLGV